MAKAEKKNNYVLFFIKQYASIIIKKEGTECSYDDFLTIVASHINYGRVSDINVNKTGSDEGIGTAQDENDFCSESQKRVRKYFRYRFSIYNENLSVRCFSDYLSTSFRRLLGGIAEGRYKMNDILDDKSSETDIGKPGCSLHKYDLALLFCLGVCDYLSLQSELAAPFWNNKEKIVYRMFNNLFTDDYVLFSPFTDKGTSESNLEIFKKYFKSADVFVKLCEKHEIKLSHAKKIAEDGTEHIDEHNLADLIMNKIHSIPLADSVLNNDSQMFADFVLTCISSIDFARNTVTFLNPTLSFSHNISNRISAFTLDNNKTENGFFTPADLTKELEKYAYSATVSNDHIFRLRDDGIFKKDDTVKCHFFNSDSGNDMFMFNSKIERLYFLALYMTKEYRNGKSCCDTVNDLIRLSGININDINFAPPKPEYDTVMLLSGFFFRNLSSEEIKKYVSYLSKKAMDFSSENRTMQISVILIIISILTDCEIYGETRKKLFNAAFSRAEYSFHRKQLKYLSSMSGYYHYEIGSAYRNAKENANPDFFFYYDLIMTDDNDESRRQDFKPSYDLKNKSWRSVTGDISNEEVSDAISKLLKNDNRERLIEKALASQAVAFAISNIIQADKRIDRIVSDHDIFEKHGEEAAAETVSGFRKIMNFFNTEEDLRTLNMRKEFHAEKLENAYNYILNHFNSEEDVRALIMRKEYYAQKLEKAYMDLYGSKSSKSSVVPLSGYLSGHKHGENLRNLIFYSDFILKKNNVNYQEQNSEFYLPAASYRLANIPGFLKNLPGKKINLSQEEISLIKKFQDAEKDLRYKFLYYRLVHECVDEASFEAVKIDDLRAAFENVSFFEYDNIDYASILNGRFYGNS